MNDAQRERVLHWLQAHRCNCAHPGLEHEYERREQEGTLQCERCILLQFLTEPATKQPIDKRYELHVTRGEDGQYACQQTGENVLIIGRGTTPDEAVRNWYNGTGLIRVKYDYEPVSTLKDKVQLQTLGDHPQRVSVANLNLDHDAARAVHRIVRAMHDGECPRCHTLHDAGAMIKVEPGDWPEYANPPAFIGHECPDCGFRISQQESTAAIAAFGEFMDRNRQVFEMWRALL